MRRDYKISFGTVVKEYTKFNGLFKVLNKRLSL